MKASAASKLHAEEIKLQRRIDNFCTPRGVLGRCDLVIRRWRLLKKLRARFEVPYAMFFTQRNVAHRHTKEQKFTESAP